MFPSRANFKTVARTLGLMRQSKKGKGNDNTQSMPTDASSTVSGRSRLSFDMDASGRYELADEDETSSVMSIIARGVLPDGQTNAHCVNLSARNSQDPQGARFGDSLVRDDIRTPVANAIETSSTPRSAVRIQTDRFELMDNVSRPSSARFRESPRPMSRGGPNSPVAENGSVTRLRLPPLVNGQVSGIAAAAAAGFASETTSAQNISPSPAPAAASGNTSVRTNRPASNTPTKWSVADIMQGIKPPPGQEEIKRVSSQSKTEVFFTLHTALRQKLADGGFELEPFKHIYDWNDEVYKRVINDPRLINIDTREYAGSVADGDRTIPIYLVYVPAALSEDCETTIAYDYVFKTYHLIRDRFISGTHPFIQASAWKLAIHNHSITAHRTYIFTFNAVPHTRMSVNKFTRICDWMGELVRECDDAIKNVMESLLRQKLRVRLNPLALAARRTHHEEIDDTML